MAILRIEEAKKCVTGVLAALLALGALGGGGTPVNDMRSALAAQQQHQQQSSVSNNKACILPLNAHRPTIDDLKRYSRHGRVGCVQVFDFP